MKTDIHSHLIFGIDDGSRTLKESRKLLSVLRAQGVTHLALTPHYYSYEMPLDVFLEKRQKNFETLQNTEEAQALRLTLGAEVYFNEMLFNNPNLEALCYGKTRYMLVELRPDLSELTQTTLRRLTRLVDEYGITPILAHIDRYGCLFKNRRNLEKLSEIGCLFQVNVEAFCHPLRRLRAAKLFRDGLIHFVGEDLHRNPIPSLQKEKGFMKMEKKCPGFAEQMDRNAREMIFEK